MEFETAMIKAVINMVQYIDYRLGILEAYGLCPRRLIGHVVNRKKLVVTKKYPIH